MSAILRLVRLWPMWLVPMLFGLALACGAASSMPPTLSVLEPTATFTDPARILPTPSLPPGAVVKRPVDPAIGDLLNLVQSDRLMVAVGSLVDTRTRHVLSEGLRSPGGIADARAWLLAQFGAIRDANPQQTITTWTQPVKYYWNGFNVASQNVVAILQGTDVGAGVILVGAHYDSMAADFTNGQAAAPGADDNGSGVAAMLEIARIMAAHPHRATIIFVAFSAEETGRQGSLTFVQGYLQLQASPIDLRAMINLDIIGSGAGASGQEDDRTIRLFSAGPNESPSRQLARQMALIVTTYLNDVDPVVQSAEERIGRWGDQQSFREAGYPAVRMIEALEDLNRERSERDTLDNVQPAYLMKTTRAALAVIAILADGLSAPADLKLRVSPVDPDQQTLSWTPVPDAAGYLVTLRQQSSLFFDEVFTVRSSELTWGAFRNYTAVSVATIDAVGRMGPLSPESPIADLLRR